MRSYAFKDKRNPNRVIMTHEEITAKARAEQLDWFSVFVLNEDGELVGCWEWSKSYTFRWTYFMDIIPKKLYAQISEDLEWYR